MKTIFHTTTRHFVSLVVCLSLVSVVGCRTDSSAENQAPQTSLTTSSVFRVTKEPVRWVDPFIGTAGDHGQLHPAASLPFGMVQMGPETPGRPHSGYDFNATTLEGFAHTRTAGVGCRGSGGSILMRADYGSPKRDESGALVPVTLDKAKEFASVGSYQVSYGTPAIAASMTVSPASGWQQYHFAKPGEVIVTLDVEHAHHKNYGGTYNLTESGLIQGEVSGPTVCLEGKFRFFYSLYPKTPPLNISQPDKTRLQLHYQVKQGEVLEFHTGISAVSTGVAEASRQADAAIGGFDEARNEAVNQWQNVLSKVQIVADEPNRKLFYSHLYQLYLSPSNLTASTNTYRASDNQIYQKQGHDYYFGWSIWDNFRTQLPLLTLLEPGKMADITASLALLYSQGKQNWATQTEPLPTVRTEHAGVVLLDAWSKGIQSFDLKKVLPLLAKEADSMPRKSPDQVLEAAYDDWAVARFAAQAGNDVLAQTYQQRATQYRPLWRDKFKTVTDTFDIMHGDGLYEGTLWQYRWFVPYDTHWLINELGGASGFNQQLQRFFNNELYNMGNQPDIQSPFMFTFSGEAWRTQKVVHDLLHSEYRHWYGTHDKKPTPEVRRSFLATPEGMIKEMDNDAATMSGWYVFTVMGMYPAVPGVPVYSLHTPQVKAISIQLENGKTWNILTDKDPVTYPYIKSAKLNGKPLNRAWLRHDELTRGGTLSFVLSAKPVKDWGIDNVFTTTLAAN